MSSRQRSGAPPKLSRRQFLGTMGAGAAVGSAAALGAPGILAQPAHAAPAPAVQADRFSRMFERPAFAAPSPQLNAALLDIGKPGGMLDAGDAVGIPNAPALLITDPALNRVNQNHPFFTAGTTFLGQFLDHDMTFDVGSRLGSPTSPESARNARTPAFDLDSVYGGGPVESPQLYDSSDPIKFKVERVVFEDLPRLPDLTAIIADPRNDENLILSGLHCAFLLFHNHAVDHVRSVFRVTDPDDVFNMARRLVTWHYQWIILHDFLPLLVGQPLIDDIRSGGRRFYTPAGASIPVEFQAAAYRFGHSLVRPSYRANLAGDAGGSPFFGLIFDPAATGPDPVDLSGHARAPRRFVGWQTFFNFADGEVRPSKRIDTVLSTPLFNLPLKALPNGAPPQSLPQRNLLRHVTWELPSGQDLASEMGVPPLSADDLSDLAVYGLGLESSTPLWFYILREAELVAGGKRLAGVGARIVAEVFIGLLELDDASYLSVKPTWTPTLPSVLPGQFRMTDLLTFAGVNPASRGQ